MNIALPSNAENITLLNNIENVTSTDDIINLIKHIDAIAKYYHINYSLSIFDHSKILDYLNIKKENIDALYVKYKIIINNYLIGDLDKLKTIIIGDDIINLFYNLEKYCIFDYDAYDINSANPTELLIFITNILRIVGRINDNYMRCILNNVNKFDSGHLQLLDGIIDYLIKFNIIGNCFYFDSNYKFNDDITNLYKLGSNTILYKLYVNNVVNIDYILSKIGQDDDITFDLYSARDNYFKCADNTKCDVLLALFLKYNNIEFIYLFLQHNIILSSLVDTSLINYIFKLNNNKINNLYISNIINKINKYRLYKKCIEPFIEYYNEEVIIKNILNNLSSSLCLLDSFYIGSPNYLQLHIVEYALDSYNKNIMTLGVLQILNYTNLISWDEYIDILVKNNLFSAISNWYNMDFIVNDKLISLCLQLCDLTIHNYLLIRYFYNNVVDDSLSSDIVNYTKTLINKYINDISINNGNCDCYIFNFIDVFNDSNFSKFILINILTYYSIYYKYLDDFSYVYANVVDSLFFFRAVINEILESYNIIITIPIYTISGDLDQSVKDNVLYNGDKVLDFLNTYTEYKWEIVDNFLLKNEK